MANRHQDFDAFMLDVVRTANSRTDLNLIFDPPVEGVFMRGARARAKRTIFGVKIPPLTLVELAVDLAANKAVAHADQRNVRKARSRDEQLPIAIQAVATEFRTRYGAIQVKNLTDEAKRTEIDALVSTAADVLIGKARTLSAAAEAG